MNNIKPIDGEIVIDDTVEFQEKVEFQQGISFTGTPTITLEDNTASALDIKEGSNSYMKFVTTNSGERINIAKEIYSTGQPIFISTNDANQTIGPGANTVVIFPDIPLVDQGGVGYSGGTFTINSTGTYLIHVKIVWSANATGYRNLYIEDDNGNFYGNHLIYPANATTWREVTSAVAYLSATDTFQVKVFQNTVGNLDLEGSIQRYRTQIGIVKLF